MRALVLMAALLDAGAAMVLGGACADRFEVTPGPGGAAGASEQSRAG